MFMINFKDTFLFPLYIAPILPEKKFIYVALKEIPHMILRL